MIELCSEYLSVWCIWLYVLAMSRTRFAVNPHSILFDGELIKTKQTNIYKSQNLKKQSQKIS